MKRGQAADQRRSSPARTRPNRSSGKCAPAPRVCPSSSSRNSRCQYSPHSANAPSSSVHPLGTDAIGRDMLSRLVHGARLSLAIGIFVVALAVMAGVALFSATMVTLLLGMLCARREGTLFDRAVCKLGTITSCIPEFWLSLLLILIFAIELRMLPSSGAYSIGQQNNIADRAAHLILPLAVVVLGHLWYYAYMIRNRLLDEMRADYVLLAKAKGLTRRAVMLRHCLRNTMPTYLSIMAISVPHVLGGTYIVETVFSYPGLGTLAYESARYKDYNLLMLLSLLSGALVILCSIIAQTINEQIDPRIRAEQAVREAEVQP